MEFSLHNDARRPKDKYGMANSGDPDQTAPEIGLHFLPRHLTFLRYFKFTGKRSRNYDLVSAF